MTTSSTNIDELLGFAVAARPGELAIADAPNRSEFFGGEPLRLTWTQLDSMVDGMVSSLEATGVSGGDRVGFQLPNTVELVVTLLACIRMGAIGVPFPIQHRAHELRYGIGTADVTAFVTAARPDRPSQLDDVAGVVAEFDGVAMASLGASTHPDATSIGLEPGSPSAPRSRDPEDLVTICWTSGTTGTPKGVPRDHRMWLAAAAGQVGGTGLTSADRILCPFPLVNMAGLGGMLFPWLMSQSLLVLHQPLDLPVFLEQIQSEAITYTVAPPALLNMLLRNKPLLDGVDLSSIRAITSGSSALDPWMVEGWQDRGIEVINAFGSNEGISLMSTRQMVESPTDRARYFPRVGRREFDFSFHSESSTRLVDMDTGSEILEAGIPGELRYKGPTIFNGYIGSTGEEFDADGYFRSGDIFELAGDQDPPQFYRFLDRAKDIIIRGGMNISAAEIEAMVASLSSVAEAAAIAFPDADLGEKVGIFVVAAGPEAPTLDDIVTHMRGQDVASYKLPERLEVVPSLPRNPVGKVVKAELRQLWSDK